MKKSKSNNVLALVNHPKFQSKAQESRSKILVPCAYGISSPENAAHFTVSGNRFGFSAGDGLVCKTNFTNEEIHPHTLVIVRNETSGNTLTIAACVDLKDIVAIPVCLIREVGR